ncbi:MAG: cryptochrome/photolyase family protein, partial [Pyrinomonadaceae bacterium]
MTQKYRILRLILGDQLNPQHSWFRERNEKILYCMMEVRQETDYVRHHIQKIVGFFLAMRSFANLLRQKGHNVFYFTINDLNNRHSIPENLQWLIHKFK